MTALDISRPGLPDAADPHMTLNPDRGPDLDSDLESDFSADAAGLPDPDAYAEAETAWHDAVDAFGRAQDTYDAARLAFRDVVPHDRAYPSAAHAYTTSRDAVREAQGALDGAQQRLHDVVTSASTARPPLELVPSVDPAELVEIVELVELVTRVDPVALVELAGLVDAATLGGATEELRSRLLKLTQAQYGFCPAGHHRAVRIIRTGREARSELFCPSCAAIGR